MDKELADFDDGKAGSVYGSAFLGATLNVASRQAFEFSYIIV